MKYYFYAHFALKKVKENSEFLGKNHGLTPLEKCDFGPFEKFLFVYSKIVSFLFRTL